MPRRISRTGFLLAALLLGALSAPGFAASVRVIMVEQAGCRYCIDWDREIAPGYARSAQGRFAPLKRANRGDNALKAFKPVIYTPTFIVERDGAEVGRVTGYAGKMFFWDELDEQLAKAGFRPDYSIPEVGKPQSNAAPVPQPQALAQSRAIHVAN